MKNKVSDFQKIRYLITRRDKFILLFLLIATFFLSMIETIAVSIIMPFITFASNPNMIFQNKFTKYIYEKIGFESTLNFMITFSVLMISFYIFRSFYNIFYSYCLNRFAFRKYHFFAYRLFCKSIELNYIDFVSKNMDKIRQNIIQEALKVSQYMQQLLVMCAEIVTMVLMYALLLVVSWKMTIVLTIILIINVILITKTVSKSIQKQGVVNVETGEKVLRIISKTLGNFKIIKLKGIQKNVLLDFDNVSKSRVDSEITYQTLVPLPRFILETIGFSMLIGAVTYILILYNDASAVIPIISMYALALYKILPSLNRILQSFNMMKYYKTSLEVIYEDLTYHIEYEDDEYINFEEKIELENINFEYIDNRPVIKDFNLTINKKDKIAFIGESGSGKSTLIDIIIGIYKPCLLYTSDAADDYLTV